MLGVARHTPILSMKRGHGFLPGLAHVTPRLKRAKARRDMAEGLRPPPIPLSTAAIGRLLSRMPVIIRSHEGSPDIMREDAGWGMEKV